MPELSEGEIWRRFSRLRMPATRLFEPVGAPQAISGSGGSRLPPFGCRLYFLSYPALVLSRGFPRLWFWCVYFFALFFYNFHLLVA